MGGSGIRYNVRRLLLDAAEEISMAPASAGNPFAGGASEDIVTNLVIKLVVLLLLAMTCVLVLKSIVRRVLRRGGGVSPETAATAGMEKRDLRRIPVAAYRVGAGIAEECSICLADFAEGERVRVLPGCGHGFHVACVDRWLVWNSSCPNCRHSLLENKSAPSKAADGGGGRRPDVESGGGGS